MIGRPAKKAFRFSFVEGNIYLTWKGKFGNQGVGMGEVTSVVAGIGEYILLIDLYKLILSQINQ